MKDRLLSHQDTAKDIGPVRRAAVNNVARIGLSALTILPAGCGLAQEQHGNDRTLKPGENISFAGDVVVTGDHRATVTFNVPRDYTCKTSEQVDFEISAGSKTDAAPKVLSRLAVESGAKKVYPELYGQTYDDYSGMDTRSWSSHRDLRDFTASVDVSFGSKPPTAQVDVVCIDPRGEQ